MIGDDRARSPVHATRDLHEDGLGELDHTFYAPNPLPRWMRREGQARDDNGLSRRSFRRARRRRTSFHCIIRSLVVAILLVISLVLVCGIFFPSYSSPPQHYLDLGKRALLGGGVNGNNEKIFIAASLHDPSGELLDGAWAHSVRRTGQ